MKNRGQSHKKKAVTKLGMALLTINVALFFAKGDYKAHSILPLQTSLFDPSIDLKACFSSQDNDPMRLSSDEHYDISFHKQIISVYWANDSLSLSSEFSKNNQKETFVINTSSQNHKNKPIPKWKIKTVVFNILRQGKISYL